MMAALALVAIGLAALFALWFVYLFAPGIVW